MHTDTNAYSLTKRNRYRDAYGHSYGDSHPNSNCNAYCYSDGETLSHA